MWIYSVAILKHNHLTTISWTVPWMQYGGTKHTADWGGVFIQMLTCINPDINNYSPLFQCRRIINQHITINIVTQN